MRSNHNTTMKSLAAIAALSAALALAACGEVTNGASTDTDGPIKIGAAFPLTGTLAFSGERGLEGARIAADLINEDGGIDGRDVEIVPVDASDTSAAQSGVTRLITRDKVVAVIGSTASSISAVSAPTAERLGGFFWETSAIADSVTASGYQHVFRTITRASDQGDFAGKYTIDVLADQLHKDPSELNVGVLYTDDSYGGPIAEAEVGALEDGGANVVVDAPYQADSIRDFSPTILKLKNSDVDIVYQAGQLPDTILFWRQLKQSGLKLAAVGGTGSGYAEEGFSKTLGNAIDGVFNVVPPTPGSIDQATLSPEAAKVLDRYEQAIKDRDAEQTSNMDWAFMGSWVLMHDVLPAADDLSPDALREAALSLDLAPSDTITGYGVKFDESGQNTRAYPVVQQWQDGRLVTIYPKNLAVAEPLTNTLPAG